MNFTSIFFGAFSIKLSTTDLVLSFEASLMTTTSDSSFESLAKTDSKHLEIVFSELYAGMIIEILFMSLRIKTIIQ